MIDKNYRTFIIYKTLSGFSPEILFIILYFEQLLGSYTLAASIVAINLTVTFLSEIPLGIMSDYIGRRKTMILGGLCNVLAYVLFILPYFFHFAPAYLSLAVAAIAKGLTSSLYSGTEEAIVFETSSALGHQEVYKNYYSSGMGWHHFMLATSALLAGIVAYYTDYVYCYVITLFFTVAVAVNNFKWIDVEIEEKQEAKQKSCWHHLKEAISLFTSSKTLKYIATASIIEKSSRTQINRMETAYFQELIPEYLLGIPRMLKQYMGAFGFAYAAKFIEKHGALKVMTSSTLLYGFVRFISLVLNNMTTPFIASLVSLFLGNMMTAKSDILQHEFAPQSRATMNSVINMWSCAVSAFMIVLIGYLADLISLRNAMFVFLLFNVLAVIIYVKLGKINPQLLNSR